MSISFNPKSRLIIIRAEIWGASESAVLSIALDTGATFTFINQNRLIQLGYDPAAAAKRLKITTGSRNEIVPEVRVNRIAALGQERTDFSVLSHNLPPSAGIDGLLGLDFLRNQSIMIDFRTGKITLN